MDSQDSEFKERWGTYESNVQSYRANMIASQSFLLAVGAIFYSKNIYIEIVCCLIALFQLWCIWFRVIRVRTLIVDFYKFKIYDLFNNEGIYEKNSPNALKEDVYVKNRSVRKKVNQKLAEVKNNSKLKHNFRLTRIKLDILLPVSFTIIWTLILIFSILALTF